MTTNQSLSKNINAVKPMEYLPASDCSFGKITQVKDVLSSFIDSRIDVITDRVQISPKGQNTFSDMTDVVFNTIRSQLIEQYVFGPVQEELLRAIFKSNF